MRYSRILFKSFSRKKKGKKWVVYVCALLIYLPFWRKKEESMAGFAGSRTLDTKDEISLSVTIAILLIALFVF